MIDEFEFNILLSFLIPENLPVFGVKIRLYYHGMPKQCGKCYELGHVKAECTNLEKTWVQYVNDLVEQGVPLEHLGAWVERPTPRGRARGAARGLRGQRGNRGHGGRGGSANRARGRGATRGQRGFFRGQRSGRGYRGGY